MSAPERDRRALLPDRPEEAQPGRQATPFRFVSLRTKGQLDILRLAPTTSVCSLEFTIVWRGRASLSIGREVCPPSVVGARA